MTAFMVAAEDAFIKCQIETPDQLLLVGFVTCKLKSMTCTGPVLLVYMCTTRYTTFKLLVHLFWTTFLLDLYRFCSCSQDLAVLYLYIRHTYVTHTSCMNVYVYQI